jgi:Na+/phosphate symporter
METKSIFRSWTIWFGILQLLLGTVGLVSGLMQSSEALTLITTGLGTVGLRFKTAQPII